MRRPIAPRPLPSDARLARWEGLERDQQWRLARSSRWEVAAALATNTTLDPSTQRLLEQRGNEWVTIALIQNPTLLPSVQRRIAKRSGASERVQYALASRLPLDLQAQEALLMVGKVRIDRAIASNPSAGAHLQSRFATHPAPSMRTRLAANRGVCEALLATLVKDSHWQVRAGAAGNPAVTALQQQALAEDRSLSVVRALAGNPQLAGPAQTLLASRSDLVTLEQLAGNGALLPAIATMLMDTAEESVLARLAGNPRLPAGDQVRLANNRPEVGMRLADNHGLVEEAQWILLDSGADVQKTLATNPAVAPSVQMWLATRGAGDARQYLAGRSTDPAVLAVLARDPDERVRASAADRVSDPQLQQLLAGDEASTVRRSLARNRHLAPDVMDRLALDPDAYVLSALTDRSDLRRSVVERVIAETARRRSGSIGLGHANTGGGRLGSATHWHPTHLDDDVLGPMIAALTGKANVQRAAAAHPDRFVRLGVAGNAKVKAAVLQTLLQDTDPAVVAAAGRRALSAMAGL